MTKNNIHFYGKSILTLAVAAAAVAAGGVNVKANEATTITTTPQALTATSAAPQALASTSQVTSSATSSIVATSSAVSTTLASATSADTSAAVQILGINDFHGYIDTTNTAHLPSSNVKGAGTAALLAGYLNSETASFASANANAVTLKVEAGDMIGASPATSNLLYDQPTMAVLNAMGIQVGTLGNHDFDKGLQWDNDVLNGINPEPGVSSIADQFYQEYTQQQLAGGFETVISNVVDKNTGEPPFGYQPYTILTETTPDGQTIKVGFIGVITTETPDISNPQNVSQYEFLDPATQIAKYSAILQGQGVNAIVVLGHTASDNEGDNGVVGETADIITKLNQIDPNNSVDLYIAGHSHTYTDGVVGGIRVVQALSYGEAFDDVTADYDFATNDFDDSTIDANIVAVDPTKGVTPDSTVASIVSNAEVLTSELTTQPVGQLASGTVVSRSANAIGESPMGDLVTYAQYETALSDGVPVIAAMTNDGGIRTDLVANSDGSVTWGAAQAVQPFGDTIEAVQMTGQQIEDVLNQQTFDSGDAGTDQFYLQEYGIKYTVKPNPDKTDITHPYVVATMTDEAGNPISLTKTYDVVINDYIYAGGDGFTAFENLPLVDGYPQDTDTNILTNFFKSLAAKGEKIPVSFEAQKSLYVASETPGSPDTGGNSVTKVPENTTKVSNVTYTYKNTKKALPATGDSITPTTELLGISLLAGAATLVSLKKRNKAN
ncbi:MAG: 5'-nucleotidase C-terminal domain-containing protein [Streptococcaceae bacterium]|jgi:5'-nucleotidase|nr:5'-nucleotidase C-terminal domain-containing protein [Streptococcaceae bacterium]